MANCMFVRVCVPIAIRFIWIEPRIQFKRKEGYITWFRRLNWAFLWSTLITVFWIWVQKRALSSTKGEPVHRSASTCQFESVCVNIPTNYVPICCCCFIPSLVYNKNRAHLPKSFATCRGMRANECCAAVKRVGNTIDNDFSNSIIYNTI